MIEENRRYATCMNVVKIKDKTTWTETKKN